jgi:hypothetical protein
MAFDLTDVPTRELENEIAIRVLLKSQSKGDTPWCAWNDCRGCEVCKAYSLVSSRRGAMAELRRRVEAAS